MSISDNLLCCVIGVVAITGCTTCSVSEHYRDTRKLEIEAKERIEILKAFPSPKP